MKQAKINPDSIPEADYETACCILDKSVRTLFRNPQIQAEYKKFEADYEAERNVQRTPGKRVKKA